MTKKLYVLLLLALLLPLTCGAEGFRRLSLPDRDQLSSGRILAIMQDDEGCLWYATEGGGICRDDGRQLDVFRSDAKHPDLMGSNNVSCLASKERHIIIGTFHGAYLLDKDDFSIRRLQEVDDKRVDDILVTRNGDVLLTSNMKIFRYNASLQYRQSYDSPGKYVARLFEDGRGRIWASQWQGGLLQLQGNKFVSARWPMNAQPTAMADAGDDGSLWIGTLGRGIVRYQPESGIVYQQPQAAESICIDLLPWAEGRYLWASTTGGLRLFDAQDSLLTVSTDGLDSISTSATGRLSVDRQGRLLVACGEGRSFAVSTELTTASKWEQDIKPMRHRLDSVRDVRRLTARPVAMAFDAKETLWFSTGHDIRRQPADGEETIVLPDTKDVSAMAVSPDGTLWMGTIFGVVYAYDGQQLTTDSYASNEQGDAIVSLHADSTGLLTMVYEHYVRRYDPKRQTLRQQSIEDDGVYRIELQPTQPGKHWSQPPADKAVERLPQWMTAWWMWGVYALLIVAMAALLIHYFILRRNSRHDSSKELMTADGEPGSLEQPTSAHDQTEQQHTEEHTGAAAATDPFLVEATAKVEEHLSNENYSVEQLAADLCMSRMTFYRKILSATGKKPNEFIRVIRLEHAKKMLGEGHATISEICYATGFSSVSYFSRCFRALYGVSPKQFRLSAPTEGQGLNG